VDTPGLGITHKQRGSFSFAGVLSLLLALMLTMPHHTINAVEVQHENNNDKLTQLQTRITNLQLELERDNKSKNRALNQLKTSEKKISAINVQLANLDKNIAKTHKTLQQLQSQQQHLTQQIGQHKKILSRQIRASYIIGKQEYIKLLLNQQNPATVSRVATYYRYFTNARVNQIQKMSANIALLNTTHTQIDAQTEELQQMRQQVNNNKATLETQRKQRKQIVAKLSKRLQKKDDALKILLRDEEHLKIVLQQLKSDLSDIDHKLTPHKDFKALKGSLPWPTRGKITANFGTIRQTSQLKWKGVLISTQPGKAIHAIAHGQVVFADWLRGFGMLMIINHGKGYMSLYGHNESLHKKLGDWVNANEIIAAAGASGGQKNSSLYFEIRHNGKPQNPKRWCKASPS